MYIKIAQGVQVWITNEQINFINKYKDKESFCSTDLLLEEVETARILGDKSIFVRKKLDDGMQYALNKRIKFVTDAKKK